MATNQNPDLLLALSDTGELLHRVYKYVSGEGANAVYVGQGDTQESITLAQLQSLFNPRDTGLMLKPIDRLWGVSLQDILNRVNMQELDDTYGGQGFDILMRYWKWHTENPKKDPMANFNVLTPQMSSIWQNITDYLQPEYNSWKIAQAPAVEPSSWYPEQQDLNFQDENARADFLSGAAVTKFLESKFPGEVIDKLFINGNDDAYAVAQLQDALAAGDPIDSFLENPMAQEFYTGIERFVTPRTAEAPVEGKSSEQVKQETIVDNLESIVRDYQSIYGVDSKTKILDYLKEYANEYDWAKMPGDLTVEGDTGAFPSIYESDEIVRFSNWLKEKESTELETSTEEDKLKRQQVNLESIIKIYTDRYGVGGRKLATLAIDYAKAQGSDLYFITDVMTPEAALSRWIPENIRNIYQTLEIDPSVYLQNLVPGVTPEDTAKAYRGLATEAATEAIQSGRFSPEITGILKENINAAIATAPAPEGGRKFYLSEAAASNQFREFLTGALPAGKYRSGAWEYFPQVWKNFPGKDTLGGSELFTKQLEELGSTFFARLTPKPERVTTPKSVRPPGGGRIPIR